MSLPGETPETADAVATQLCQKWKGWKGGGKRVA